MSGEVVLYQQISLDHGLLKDAMCMTAQYTSVTLSCANEWVHRDVGRTLTGGGYDDNVAMTYESCINYCNTAGYIYAGTEYSAQCCNFPQSNLLQS